jgi:transcriptional regulator with XRE-family HTH domain
VVEPLCAHIAGWRKSFTVKDFGERVRAHARRGYSQEGFAHAVDWTRTYIGGIELRRTQSWLKAVLKIAETLALPASGLFDAIDRLKAVDWKAFKKVRRQ